MMVELACLYIITFASLIYIGSKLYEFVKADIPAVETVPAKQNKNNKKKGRR